MGGHSAHGPEWFVKWFIGFSDEASLNLVGLAKKLRFRETSSAVSHVDFAETLRVVKTPNELKILFKKHSMDGVGLVGLSTLRSLQCSDFKSSGGLIFARWLTESHKVDFTGYGSTDGLHFSSAVPSSGDFFVCHIFDMSRRADGDNFVELNRLLSDHNLGLAVGDLHLRRWDALLSGREHWLAWGEETWHA